MQAKRTEHVKHARAQHCWNVFAHTCRSPRRRRRRRASSYRFNAHLMVQGYTRGYPATTTTFAVCQWGVNLGIVGQLRGVCACCSAAEQPRAEIE